MGDLPDGWREMRHDSDEQAVFYYHEATRTVCWSRPYCPLQLGISAGDTIQNHQVQDWMTAIAAPRCSSGERKITKRSVKSNRALSSERKTSTAFLHEWAAQNKLDVRCTESVTPPDIASALTKPFQCKIAVSNAEFVAYAESKKLAKHAAADAALRQLAQEHWPKSSPIADPPVASSSSEDVGIDPAIVAPKSEREYLINDVRIVDAIGLKRTPLQMLNRYCQVTGVTVQMAHDRIENLELGYQCYQVAGILSNGFEARGAHRKLVAAKHLVALSLLAQLHPIFTTYGQLLDLYTQQTLCVADLVCSAPSSFSSLSVLASLRRAMAELVEEKARDPSFGVFR